MTIMTKLYKKFIFYSIIQYQVLNRS